MNSSIYCAPAQLARDRCGMGIRQLALQAIKAGKSKKKQAKALITLERSIVLKTFFPCLFWVQLLLEKKWGRRAWLSLGFENQI